MSIFSNPNSLIYTLINHWYLIVKLVIIYQLLLRIYEDFNNIKICIYFVFWFPFASFSDTTKAPGSPDGFSPFTKKYSVALLIFFS
jgi:hypothetical protein